MNATTHIFQVSCVCCCSGKKNIFLEKEQIVIGEVYHKPISFGGDDRMKSFTELESIIKDAVRIIGAGKVAKDLQLKPNGVYKWLGGFCSISLERAELLYSYLNSNYHKLLETLYEVNSK